MAMPWTVPVGAVHALGVALSVLAALAFGLPDPWWAAISTWIVWAPDRHAMWTKAIQRIAGTLGGAAFGYGVSGFVAGLPVFQALMLFTICATATYGRYAGGPFTYGWFYTGLTATLILVESLDGGTNLTAFTEARVLEILTGVVVTLLVHAVFGAPAPAATPAPAAPPSAEDLSRVALLGGLAPIGVVVLWSLLDLPETVQMGVTSLVLADPSLVTTRTRAVQRVIGCFYGAALGLGLLVLGLDTIGIWLVALMGGIMLFSRVHLGGGSNAYVGTQGGVAFIMALVSGTGPPDTLAPALGRLLGILLGVMVIGLLGWLLAPRPKPVVPAPDTAATS